jgi:hypothetical protein
MRKFPCTLTGLLLCVLIAYVAIGTLIILVKAG